VRLPPVTRPSPPRRPPSACRCAGSDGDIEPQLERLEQLLEFLVDGRLSQEHSQLLVSTGMLKYVNHLLKYRHPEPRGARLNQFFQRVMDATVALVRDQDAWEMVEVASRILTDSPTFLFYTQSPVHAAHGERGSLSNDSSGDSDAEEGDAPGHADSIVARASAWEDLSPFYRRNVDYFSRCNGFSTLLERLGTTPVLNIPAIRVLLKPFFKVKEYLKPAAMQAFAVRIVDELGGYVQSLSDDQLKQEDRKSIQELYKLLDALVHAAKLPQASAAMDRFRLAFALKCLKTPNLEKRLHGLSDVKEMINLNQRKME
jgi:hypothetical protein